jgi:TPR repeat protein
MRGKRIYQQAKSITAKIYAKPELLGEERAIAYKEFLKLLRKAAYLGHYEAQFELGMHYGEVNCMGINTRYNPKKCIRWYSKACDGNVADACNNLAIQYINGEGCEQDIKKALELYKKAIKLGSSCAKHNYKLTLKQIKAGKYKLEDDGEAITK